MRNVIIVVSTTRKANRIAWLLEKSAINVVRRITLKLCVDPVKDPENACQIGPRNVHTDAMCMK